ncbi:hypothetical protein [Brevundimonas sp. FT23042]|uniref:hypothetical protein n=1 Tax=Brevundimonas sp. FT23042 TaxID=3393749 RepID=UPI003B587DB7
MTPLVLIVAALQAPPAEPVRAELCLAHVNLLIADAMRETGRVAGPSWFIRDWWDERTPEPDAPGALTREQRTALEQVLIERRAADPQGFEAERSACVQEAIDGDALP